MLCQLSYAPVGDRHRKVKKIIPSVCLSLPGAKSSRCSLPYAKFSFAAPCDTNGLAYDPSLVVNAVSEARNLSGEGTEICHHVVLPQESVRRAESYRVLWRAVLCFSRCDYSNQDHAEGQEGLHGILRLR